MHRDERKNYLILHSGKNYVNFLFKQSAISLLSLAEDSAEYWLRTHSADTKEEAVTWFYTVFSLFDGCFGSDMDFSNEDWEELHTIISAAAETLDMQTVSAIMSIMVERHKLLGDF